MGAGLLSRSKLTIAVPSGTGAGVAVILAVLFIACSLGIPQIFHGHASAIASIVQPRDANMKHCIVVE
jgi:hypothetical protein